MFRYENDDDGCQLSCLHKRNCRGNKSGMRIWKFICLYFESVYYHVLFTVQFVNNFAKATLILAEIGKYIHIGRITTIYYSGDKLGLWICTVILRRNLY